MRELSIVPGRFSDVEQLRPLFLQEINAQVRYDAAHTRRGAAWYLIRQDRRNVGYGALKDLQDGPGTIFEFYLVPAVRHDAIVTLRALVRLSKANALECQTNDLFYTSLVRQLSDDLTCVTVLFAAGQSNGLQAPGAVYRPRRRKDHVFEHTAEPFGDFVVDLDGAVVATGGFLLHYNPPFADLFM